jgi:hypothetical protein
MQYLSAEYVCDVLGYNSGDAQLVADIELVGEVAEEMVQSFLGFTVEETTVESSKIFDGYGTGICTFGCFARSISKVEILDINNVTLYEITDYVLQPSSNRKGLYRWMERKTDLDFPFGKANIKVTGMWGFVTIPTPIKYATALVIKHLFELRTASTTLQAESGFGRNVLFKDLDANASIPAPAKQILQPWVNRTYMMG